MCGNHNYFLQFIIMKKYKAVPPVVGPVVVGAMVVVVVVVPAPKRLFK